ncbi:MAG: pilus assembly protein PilM [Lachnospiraceae bacterium]|nr:pilus assembly protein PilM [Lachnospiraceae bacterium]
MPEPNEQFYGQNNTFENAGSAPGGDAGMMPGGDAGQAPAETTEAQGGKKKLFGRREKGPKEPREKKEKPVKLASYIGVEIGNSRLKITETRKGKIVRFITEDMPDDMVRNGEVLQWEAMGEFIKETLKKNRISQKKVALVVPDTIAYMRRTHMPPMSAAQLEYNLPYEFHDYITEDKDKYVYDYAMVGLRRDENDEVVEMDLLAVAVPKEVMNNYLRMFKRAGLKLVMAAPHSRALGNICRFLRPDVTETDYALLDLGACATRIDIFSHGIYEVTRSIDTGCRQVSAVIADMYNCDPHIAEIYMRDNKDGVLDADACRDIYSRIAIDVMRAINYYTFENRDNTLETMYYYGGGASVKALIEEISETVQLELVPLSSIAGDDEITAEALMAGAASAGICWNG